MKLIETNLNILAQLKSLLLSMNNNKFSEPLKVLSENSIGKHVRHILEFYLCLISGIELNIINYDKRERNILLETDINHAIMAIDNLILKIENQKNDIKLSLEVEYNDSNSILVESTYYRELVYNIEHSIHHFAIIAIAIKSSFPEIILDKNFGVAYSTIQYKDSKCAQ